MELKDKVAVITGGASGIGLAMARRFATGGAALVLADIEEATLATAVAELSDSGATVSGVRTDVTDPASFAALRDETLSRHGAVHVLCNNAGVAAGGPAWEVSLDVWRWVMDVNVFGVINGIHTFVPTMIDQGEGHVVNTASIAGLITAPGIGPYTASKQAVVSISETLLQDLAAAGHPVGVSVLCPAFVKTRIHEAERNAPAGLDRDFAQGAATQATWGVFGALVQAGIDAEVVADAVADAVAEGRFYVLTHPETHAWVRGRFETILGGGSPLAPVTVG
ncbi:MAG: SDR family NAD(P)-dependent oxidoreductase [Microthrixaceae bacterium]|nr:SDR family NAD(P)-dependent oxidoreductase [Microthrixaceae bacterium]